LATLSILLAFVACEKRTCRIIEICLCEQTDQKEFSSFGAGIVSDPKLVLYVGGNYFFAMAPLVAAFEQQHPEFEGRIYWETLPPDLLEGPEPDRSKRVDRSDRPLRDQFPDDHGAGGQSRPCQRSLQSGAA
jgi:hypothetical protein